MVKKIPKKIISKKILNKKSLKGFSYKPQNILNKYIPKELRKYLKNNKNNKNTLNSRTYKNKPLTEAAILRNEKLKYSERIINQIHTGIGFSGTESHILKDALNLKPTSTKTGIERLEKIAKQLRDEEFNINRYLGKNKVYKELKEIYNFKMDKNMVKIYDKSKRQLEIEKRMGFLRRNGVILSKEYSKEYNELRNELNKIKRNLGKELNPKDKPINVGGSANEAEKSLKDFMNFIFRSAKEREFYEENKDFFRATGGGTKENRANPAYVKAVRGIRGEFLNNWNQRKYKSIIDDFNQNTI